MKRTEHAQTVAETIIKKIKEGTAPWQQPWTGGAPHNGTTGKAYRGANTLWLALQGRSDDRWATYKQAKANGWQVRKGERGTRLQFWQFVGKRENDNGEEETYNLARPFVRHFTVFNFEQIDGVPAKETTSTVQANNAAAAAALARATVEHKYSAQAFYSVSEDKIVLPLLEQFTSEQGYWGTALHELAHWTGHETRLNRDFTDRPREELRAEIASYMLGMHFGTGHRVNDTAAYVQSWVQALENDPMEIMRAAGDAQKIVDFITQQ